MIEKAETKGISVSCCRLFSVLAVVVGDGKHRVNSSPGLKMERASGLHFGVTQEVLKY